MYAEKVTKNFHFCGGHGTLPDSLATVLVKQLTRKVQGNFETIRKATVEGDRDEGGFEMAFFTVRATLVGSETGAADWRFKDRNLAEDKFKEVCGPLCAEAWLLRWEDDPFIRGKKEVHLDRHWTFRTGVDSNHKMLGRVTVLEDSEAETASQSRVGVVTERPETVSDISLNLLRGHSVHNLQELEIDFDSPSDDSNIHVLVDQERITVNEGYGHFELTFAKVSRHGTISIPDYSSPFYGLRLTCQWNMGDDWGRGDGTYGYSAQYSHVGTVGLRRAQTMAEMLRKVEEIEQTFPFQPKSFGEYVVVMAERLGLNPDSVGCLENQDSEETRTRVSKKVVRLASSELRVVTDDAISGWVQTHGYPRKHRIFVVSDEEAIVEAIPKMLVKHGCDAFGSLSVKKGSWMYEKVLKEAEEFQPNVLFIFYNNHLCPKIDDLDLPSRLLRRFLFAKVLITKVGDVVSVREEVLDYLERGNRPFHIVDVPFEVEQVLSLIVAKPESDLA